MTIFQVFFGFLARFRLVFDFFGGYVDPGAESPRQPLFRLFSEFSREKAFDSCRWPTISQWKLCFELSDPRNRNHKSLAIANHNFEVASFSRRNRNEIAVLEVFSESQ